MDDYISRESVIMRILCAGKIGKQTCIDIIKHETAADVRPVVRGEWRLYSPLTDTYECDHCGYQVIDECFSTNFCPNCGADMRKENDDNV